MNGPCLTTRAIAIAWFAAAISLAGCSDDSTGGSGGSGGSGGTGGTAATGGSGGTGGAAATGGSGGTGGTAATGGSGGTGASGGEDGRGGAGGGTGGGGGEAGTSGSAGSGGDGGDGGTGDGGSGGDPGTGGGAGSGGSAGSGGGGDGGSGGSEVPNLCPSLFILNAIPSNISPGNNSALVQSRAQDPDGGPQPLVLTLRALFGSFENTEVIPMSGNVVGQNATYICGASGSDEICVDATDGACVKTLCDEVSCP
ncbi:MAG: hypothetical protein AAF997_04260 [Myxococcota bacterium]